MSLSKSVVSTTLGCAVGLAGFASAASPPSMTSVVPQAKSSTAQRSSDVYGFGQPVSTATLQRYSGGALTTNNQAINGTVSNDSAAQVVTGNNAITGDAFSNASGLPSVIQNTGNNVLIQNGVIVNLEMKQ